MLRLADRLIQVNVLYVQRILRTQHYTVLRLVGYAHLHLSLTAHILCKSVQHGSAAGQRYAVGIYIPRKLGRRLRQRILYCAHYAAHRLYYGIAYLTLSYDYAFGQPGIHASAPHLHMLVPTHEGAAQCELYLLRSTFAYAELIFPGYVLHYGLVNVRAARTD